MKCENGKVGGFPPSGDGWHSFVVTDASKYGVVDKADKSEQYKVAQIQLSVVEGEEEGRRAFPSFFMERDGDRLRFAKLLYYSKASPVIEKNYKITDDLPVDKWAEKYLNPEDPKCEKLINGAIGILIGRNVDAMIHGDPDKKTGQIRPNIREYAFFGQGKGEEGKPGARASASAAAAASSGEVASEPPPEGSGW
jgi:hypothetical protein